MDGSDPLANYRAIRSELTQYNDELGQRPEIVVVSKAELPDASEIAELLSEELDQDVLLISAVTGQGLNQLTGRISELLNPREW